LRSKFFDVTVLALASALAFSVTPLMMLLGSLLGLELAPSPDLATLPITLMVLGTAAGIIPATKLMELCGRRTALWIFIAVLVLACFLAGHSLAIKSFELFCFSAVLIGLANAALQQIRFAAMELVDLEHAATAASVIMLGGVVAAVIGPELAVAGRDINDVAYQGSFWLVAGCAILSALLLILYKPAPQYRTSAGNVSRPVTELLKNPTFCLAVASGAVGYVVMTFVMTGTPISMHNHHGHSLMDTKWVIQSHIAAMFLPSLIMPWLIRVFSIKGMMIAGLLCYGATISIGLGDTSVQGFWFQLVMLGVGWNFLFVSGTALLPSTYLEGEQFKAQAFNDGTIFSMQAAASLSAGLAISATTWQGILLLCLIPIAVMIIFLLRNSVSVKA